MNNYGELKEKVSIQEQLEDIRDSINIIVAFRPINEYEILNKIKDKIIDILIELELKKKGGEQCL